MQNDKPKVPNEVLKQQWKKPEIVNVSCAETEDKTVYSPGEKNTSIGPS